MTNDDARAVPDLAATIREYVADYDSVSGNYVIINRRGGEDYERAASLLREAAARIDADAARIAALEALVAELDAEGKWLALLRSPEGQRVLQELAAEAYREYEAGLTEDMDDDDE
jgi:hypothetical protein